MTENRRRGVAALALSIAALVAVVAIRPPHAPPLYDGLSFPDEPYRWVAPPPGSTHTAAATGLRVQLPLTTGAEVKSTVGLTAEQGPQLAIQLLPNDVVSPSGSSTVSIEAMPRPAPPPPPHGVAVSNLYAWTVTADRPGPVTLAPSSKVVVNLRADVATSQAVVLEAWDGTAWHQLGTNQAGIDIYAAFLTSWQPVALIKLDPGVAPTVHISTAPSGSATLGTATAGAGTGISSAGTVGGAGPQQGAGAGPGTALWLGAAGVLALITAGLLLARRSRTRLPGGVPPGGVPPGGVPPGGVPPKDDPDEL